MSYGIFNLARMTVSSSGTGNITLNAAVTGYLTFDLAGCSTASTGQPVTYAINDTTQSEIARGTYISSSLLLTRGSSTAGMKSTNGNSPINMSNTAQVMITPSANDLNNAQGNCYLSTPTATTLTLSPLYGNRLFINGVNEEIPSAGVTLASTGSTLVSSNYYYIYAYMNAGTMTMEASTTAYVSSAWSGVPTKSGDQTRTLVGLTFSTTTAAGSSNWSTNTCDTLSWWNPRLKAASAAGNPGLTSTTTTEINSALRVPLVQFDSRPVVQYYSCQYVTEDTAGNGPEIFPDLNGTTAFSNTAALRMSATAATMRLQMVGSITTSTIATGRHFITMSGLVNATGTCTFSNLYNQVTVWG